MSCQIGLPGWLLVNDGLRQNIFCVPNNMVLYGCMHLSDYCAGFSDRKFLQPTNIEFINDIFQSSYGILE